MIWQTSENQSMALLEEQMLDKLNAYLQKKEALLSNQIVDAIHLDRTLLTNLEGNHPPVNRLSQAVEELGKKIHLLSQMQQPHAISPVWQTATAHINEALWDYLEILESCAVELFQQIDQIGFENWDLNLSRATTAVKDELTHRMDELKWTLKRLDQQLKTYRTLSAPHHESGGAWNKFCSLWQKPLDPDLGVFLQKCQKFLNFSYQRFIDRYMGCAQLYEMAEKELLIFRAHQRLSMKDFKQLDRFKQLYQMLYLWNLNKSTKTVPQHETIRAIRHLTTPYNALALFIDYLKALRKALFAQSRSLKAETSLDADHQVQRQYHDNVTNLLSEVHLLQETISNYRNFNLETDPAYRTKWQLWPSPTKKNASTINQLDLLFKRSEDLINLCMDFQISLESESMMERQLTPLFEAEISHHLHEMGQPLASKDLMRRHAKSLLNRLNTLDELGTFHADVVGYICHTLCKALLVDWKYHVLPEFPLFHEIYDIHENIFAPEENFSHLNRLNNFRQLIEKLQQWVLQQDTVNHAEDIESDISDIKAYLQDFLAHIQRLEQSREPGSPDTEGYREQLSLARQALLEYLYVFSQFFYQLHPDEPEAWLLRKQFLFVDQYFEAIDSKLRDLNA